MPREEDNRRQRLGFSRGFLHNSHDPDSPFAEKADRKRFVTKVLAVVVVMLIPPFFMAFLPHINDNIMEFFHDNTLATFLTGFLAFAVAVVMVWYFKTFRRMFPLNVILLVIMSSAISLVTATIASKYKVLVPAMSIGSTMVIVILIVLLATYGPWDVTGCGLYLMSLVCFVFVFGLLTIVLAYKYLVPLMHTLLSGLLTLLFITFIWFDMLLIMGGKRLELGTDEIILASSILFTDIIMLFISLIGLIGSTAE